MENWALQQERAAAQRPRLSQGEGHRRGGRAPSAVVVVSAGNDRVATTHNSGDLLHRTARLALDTARKVRDLTAACARAIAIPDSSCYRPPVQTLAEGPRTYVDAEFSYQWAQLVLIVLAAHPENASGDSLRLLREHAALCVNPQMLQEHVSECVLTQCFAGGKTNLRSASDSELHLLVQPLTRRLLAAGYRIRFGAASRSTQERAVLSALNSAHPAR